MTETEINGRLQELEQMRIEAMYDIELVTSEERSLVLDYAKRRIASRLTEIYDRCGNDCVESFFETTASMGVRDRYAVIYWVALSLHESDPKNMTFERLAQLIVGEIFRVKFPDVEYDLDAHPISCAISASSVDEYIAGWIEKELKVIYDLAEGFDLIPLERIMEHMEVPYAIRDIYRKAIAIHQASSGKITFKALVDNIFRIFKEPLIKSALPYWLRIW